MTKEEYDSILKEEEYKKMWDNMLKKLNEKERYYLAIVNLQKDKEIERLNNIINELEKSFVNDDKRIKEYNLEHPASPLDNYSRYYLDKLKELKGENINE